MVGGLKAIEQADLKQDELERLLNDPDVPMQASRIWTLAAEVAALAADDGRYGREG